MSIRRNNEIIRTEYGNNACVYVCIIAQQKTQLQGSSIQADDFLCSSLHLGRYMDVVDIRGI